MCGHIHGGRAFGLCLADGCDCIEVVPYCDGCAGPARNATLVDVLGGGTVRLCRSCSRSGPREVRAEARAGALEYALHAGGAA